MNFGVEVPSTNKYLLHRLFDKPKCIPLCLRGVSYVLCPLSMNHQGNARHETIVPSTSSPSNGDSCARPFVGAVCDKSPDPCHSGMLTLPSSKRHGRNAVRFGFGFTDFASGANCHGNVVLQPSMPLTIGHPNTQLHASAETELPGKPSTTAFVCFPMMIGFPG